MKRIFLIAFLLGLITFESNAQELNCRVQVLTDQVQGVNPAIFESLQEFIFEFMNNRKWTSDNFNIEERIDCSLLLNIDRSASASSNTYRATLQVISNRPVFNTNYSSPMINLRDDNVVFEFIPNTQYNFNPDQFQSNMVGILAFYAYIIIGYDYESFAARGGQPYFEMAQRIVQSAQTTNAPGWKAFEGDKNRFWIITDLMNRSFEGFRDCLYLYHRFGLDVMSDKTEQGRTAIFESLQVFDRIHRSKPMAYNTQNFFLAKSDEIVNIFSQAQPAERNALFELLSRVDPGNQDKYEQMQKGK